eukprot:Rhum_TRINITY_DN14516_c23_g1::Rhum_TRINITY_DN14516_c23_g1_i1::g.94647::m.94647
MAGRRFLALDSAARPGIISSALWCQKRPSARITATRPLNAPISASMYFLSSLSLALGKAPGFSGSRKAQQMTRSRSRSREYAIVDMSATGSYVLSSTNFDIVPMAVAVPVGSAVMSLLAISSSTGPSIIFRSRPYTRILVPVNESIVTKMARLRRLCATISMFAGRKLRRPFGIPMTYDPRYRSDLVPLSVPASSSSSAAAGALTEGPCDSLTISWSSSAERPPVYEAGPLPCHHSLMVGTPPMSKVEMTAESPVTSHLRTSTRSLTDEVDRAVRACSTFDEYMLQRFVSNRTTRSLPPAALLAATAALMPATPEIGFTTPLLGAARHKAASRKRHSIFARIDRKPTHV